MTDESVNNQNSDSGTSEVTLESLADVTVDQLSDDQKVFVKDNAGELSDEQKESFKSVLEAEEEPENIDPEKVDIKTRTPEPERKDPEPTGDDEEEIDPEDKKNISKVVDDKLDDFSGKLDDVQKVKDQQEVSDFVVDNPDFKPYKGVILKYLAHPAYKNIPVENVAKIVAGDDLQQLGAKKERQAQQTVKETQDSGTTVRKPTGGKVDWQTASSEAFIAQKDKVMGIRR